MSSWKLSVAGSVAAHAATDPATVPIAAGPPPPVGPGACRRLGRERAERRDRGAETAEGRDVKTILRSVNHTEYFHKK